MTAFIPRLIAPSILEANKYYPVIGLTGPRQSGKTSLCRHLFPDYTYVSLEDIPTRASAIKDPVAFVDRYGEKVIFDEVQNVPELFSMIQVRVDEDRSRRFILTGSSNFTLLKRITQSLAGRIALFTLLPLSFPEMGQVSDLSAISTHKLLIDGQYPGVVAGATPPYMYYSNYYQSYIERDVRELLNIKNFLKFDKFVRLLAARTGTEFNAAALSREVGVTSATISEWLSILTLSYIVYTVHPYYGNISKQLTKMPKLYFCDTGLLCYLLGLDGEKALATNSLYGAIFENLAMGELLKSRLNQGRQPDLAFFRERSGREVDALVPADGLINLYEIKSGRTYRTDYSQHIDWLAAKLPNAGQKTVIYDGQPLPPQAINIRKV